MQNRSGFILILLTLSPTLGCAMLVRPKKATELSLHEKFGTSLPPVHVASAESLSRPSSHQVEPVPQPVSATVVDDGRTEMQTAQAEARRQRDLHFAQARKQAEVKLWEQQLASMRPVNVSESGQMVRQCEEPPLATSNISRPVSTDVSRQPNHLTPGPRSTPSPFLFATITALVLSGVTWPLALRQKRQARTSVSHRTAAICPDLAETKYVYEAHLSIPTTLFAKISYSHFALGVAVTVPDVQIPVPVSSPKNASRSVIPWQKQHQCCHAGPTPPATKALALCRVSHATVHCQALLPVNPGVTHTALILADVILADVILADEILADLILAEAPGKGRIASGTTTVLRKADLLFDSECKDRVSPTVGLLPWQAIPISRLPTEEKSLNQLAKPTSGRVRSRAPLVGFVVLFGESAENGSDRQVLTIESYDLDDELTLCARVVRVA